MIPKALASLPAIAILCGCTHRTVTVHAQPTAPPPAVRANMQRQILNALDAGEGDIELRRLRDRVSAAPDDVAARLLLAAHYGARGFRDVELEHYRLAVERFPSSTEAAIALAKALRAAGSNAEAKDMLVRFCKMNVEAPANVFSYVAILADDDGDYAGAEPWHRAALLRQPSFDSFHNNLGYNLLLQKRTGEAASEFRRALELNPKSEIARNNLGIALADNPKEALLQWQSLSDPATAHNNLAALLIEQKRYAEARQEIETALSFSPRHAAALDNLELLAELDGGEAKPSALKRHRAGKAEKKALGASPAERNQTATNPGTSRNVASN